MNISFEWKIMEQRKRMRESLSELEGRFEKERLGERTKEVLEKTLQYESLGSCAFSQYTIPPVMERASGVKMWDVDGKEYIDLLCGFGVSILGHCHPRVVEAIKRQSEKLIHYFDYPSEQRAKLSQRLVQLAPGDFSKRVAFTVTGSDAIEMAIRAARWYTGGQFIITAYGGYHGTQMGSMAFTGKARMWSYYYPIPPSDLAIIRIPFAYCYRCPYEKTYPDCEILCGRFLEYFFSSKEAPYRNPSNDVNFVAALLIEPMQSSAGYIIPPPEFFHELSAFCKRYDILLISDEIQAGMGRTGKMWAIENFDIVPDIITVAKGIGGGIALSMAIGRAEIFESWAPGAYVSTFAGNHLACAVANTVLDVMEEERILEHVKDVGEYFLEGLKDLMERHPLVGEVQGKGLYLAMELVRDRKTKEPADKEAALLHKECLKNGVILQRSGYFSNRLTFIPSLIISKGEINDVLKVLDTSIGKAEREFGIT